MKDHKFLHQELLRIATPTQVKEHVLFRQLTTMRVGGPATFLVEPNHTDEIRKIITFLGQHEVPWLIMGNGSNMIVSDEGFDGVVLKIGNQYSQMHVSNRCITAQAGALLSAVSQQALQHGLTGLEFASGIPGTLGGAVSMNAGAYDGEMCHVVVTSRCIDTKGNDVILSGEDHAFGYRKSRIQEDNLLVLETEMQLSEGDPEQIRFKMKELNQRRSDKQPLQMPSAGSIFRRPVGFYAGKLIEDAGLRGYRIGGAQVSEKHCGFIVNTDNATAKDVTDLICFIQKTVFESFGIRLETEVKLLGGKPKCSF